MIGRTVSQYRILEKLGQGGMGVVYKAEDTQLKRPVALKFLPSGAGVDSEAKERFQREAMAASALDHPNICTVYQIGESDDGQLFIAMAYYEGELLSERIRRGPLDVEEAVDVGIQVATGLAKAHERGILHRDIKPSNLIRTSDGIVKILDFGLAALPDQEDLTGTGRLLGTLAYIAPEQLERPTADRRSDIWALGVVLYEMLTGERPYQGDRVTLFNRLLHEEPTPVGVLRPGLPPELVEIVGSALAKRPVDRCSSAEELLSRLTGVDQGGRAARFTWSRRVDTPQPQERAIAVLPFENVSADPDNEYFTDGLTEELINALAHIEGLRVVSRTSVFEFKGKAQNVRRIGEILNVPTVLEGRVRRAGNRVRVNAQLTDVADGYSVWSEQFEREVEDLFRLQDEITRAIVDPLQVRLDTGLQLEVGRRHSPNLEAYQLYLRGRYHWNQLTPEGLGKAQEFFQRALAKDPDYALAHVGIADFYSILGFWGALPPSEAWPAARSAAAKGLAIDDQFAEAHNAMGLVNLFYEWRSEAAEAEFRRALELNRGLATTHFYLAVTLTQAGRYEEALDRIREASRLDPLSLLIASMRGWVHYYGRAYDEAVRECRSALDYAPGFFEARAVLGLAYDELGRTEEAIGELERAYADSAQNAIVAGMLGSCLARAGEEERARTILSELDELARQRYVAPIAQALVHAGRGDAESFFGWLERAVETRDGYLRYLRVLPVYDPFREDPRFSRTLMALGLDDRSDFDPTLPLGDSGGSQR